MRLTGTLRAWNDERGFGFIVPAQGGGDLFVHIQAFPAGGGRPAAGQVLSFEVETGADGQQKARRVRWVDARVRRAAAAQAAPRPEAAAPWTWPRLLAIPAFLVLLAASALSGRLPAGLLAVPAVLSLLAFSLYAADKSAAVAGRRRTPEAVLHLLDLLGGWPGGLLAQQLFRHKTRKRAFVAVFWLTVLVDLGALALVLSWPAWLPSTHLA